MAVQFRFGEKTEGFVNSGRVKWKQVHGSSVCEVTHENQECGEVDALWTRTSIPLAVVTADCVPILLACRDERAVAAIHAGWRGTYARIVERFFCSLPSDLANPKEWVARLGPCIHAECYEVSSEIIRDFKREFSELSETKIEPASRKLDLIYVNVETLRRLGVEVEFVHDGCTYCARDARGDFRFYSYRRGDRGERLYASIQKK